MKCTSRIRLRHYNAWDPWYIVLFRPFATFDADCAVCAKGFSPGMAYSCTKCSGRTKKSGVGVAVTSVIIVPVVAVMLLRYLGRAEDDDTRGRRGASRGFLRQKCDIFQESLSKVLPLTAIKMVVVVWQIVLQVS